MGRLPLLILIVLLMMCPGQVTADFDNGVAAYGLSDFAPALREFRSAAQQGDARAQYLLGLMHENGQGVPANNTDAMKWYRMAAERGHAKSQYNLGVMHERGMDLPSTQRSGDVLGEALGVSVAPAHTAHRLGLSNSAAVKWYRMAANQGLVDAQYNLGLMYASGSGVPENYVGAYLWWTVAKAYGNEKAATKLNVLKPLMSERDIVEAQRLATDWWEQHR